MYIILCYVCTVYSIYMYAYYIESIYMYVCMYVSLMIFVFFSFIELYNASFRSLVSAKNKKKNSKQKHVDSIGSITEDVEPNANSIARCKFIEEAILIL